MIVSVLFDVSHFKVANVFQNPHFLLMSKTICVFAKGIFVKNRCVLLFGTGMQGMKRYWKLSELPLVLMQAGISRANPLQFNSSKMHNISRLEFSKVFFIPRTGVNCCETCLQSGEGAQKQTHHSPSLSSPFGLGPSIFWFFKDQTYFCFEVCQAPHKAMFKSGG